MSYKNLIVLRRVDESECAELADKLVFVNRVAKVVKGGRRFSFSALVVSGDSSGHVGFGMGKANEIPNAIAKAGDKAKKRLIRVPLVGTTIPHEVLGKFGPTTVVLKPGKPGTGVIAGSVVRAMVESAGIRDIRTKVVGSNNANNVLQATFNGLLALKEPEMIATRRGVALEEMGYSAY